MKKALNPRQVKVVYGSQNLRECMKAVMKLRKARA